MVIYADICFDVLVLKSITNSKKKKKKKKKKKEKSYANDRCGIDLVI